MRSLVVTCLLVSACETPPLKIVYKIANDAAQSCGTDSCADVILDCETVLNVRILDPADPSAPFVSICEPVPANRDHDLCSIASVPLPPEELPKRTLEVQVLVWPREVVEDETGERDCRSIPVEFGLVDGFPIATGPVLGGHALYQPGDEETVVTLGCTDLAASRACIASATQVTATVGDFESLPVSVSRNVAEQLFVDVGEPSSDSTGHKLDMTDTRPLDLVKPIGSPPAWHGNLNTVGASMCVAVLEDAPQETTAVRCSTTPLEPSSLLNLSGDKGGVRMTKGTLKTILDALALPVFPDEGLTIGIVLDENGNPAAGFEVDAVAPPPGVATVTYLSADRSSIILGGTMTTTSGMFLSTDAPYLTEFSTATSSAPILQAAGIGGLIREKVTIVVLELKDQTGG